MTMPLPQLPSFDRWVRNAFEETPWQREELFDQFYADCQAVGTPEAKAETRRVAPLVAEYLARLFENPGALAEKYTGEQLNKGFWFLAGIESDYFNTAREPHVPTALQIRWVRSLTTLYRELFSKVCTPHLSHLNEGPAHPMNVAVYMLWDMDTLSYAAKPYGVESGALVDPIFEVLTDILRIDSMACQESAIHGLGHLVMYHRSRVEAIIDGYLEVTKSIRPELRDYALAARSGPVL